MPATDLEEMEQKLYASFEAAIRYADIYADTRYGEYGANFHCAAAETAQAIVEFDQQLDLQRDAAERAAATEKLRGLKAALCTSFNTAVAQADRGGETKSIGDYRHAAAATARAVLAVERRLDPFNG